MKSIIKFVRKSFRKYEFGCEYWVNTKNIKVNPDWRKTKIGRVKFQRKLQHWYHTGEFESKIILDKDFNFLDGYSSVRVAEIKGIDKVPAYFVD